MNNTYFQATKSERDGLWYLRCVSVEKGELGERIEKTGFLKFDTQAEAAAAFTKLENNEYSVEIGASLGGNLYTVKAVKVETEVAA